MRRASSFIVICFLVIAFHSPTALAQSGSSTAKQPGITPETAFVSPLKYTNAFFGFSLVLPQDSTFHDFTPPFTGDHPKHSLLGLEEVRVLSPVSFIGDKLTMTVFFVTATQSKDASPEEAREASSRPEAPSKQIQIGGREFWKGESLQKGSGGKMWSVTYATALNGYILQFDILSFDRKVADKLQRSIEAISFFDPAKAEEMAGPDSRAYSPAASHDTNNSLNSSSTQVNLLDPGAVSGSTYTNSALGFDYQFPAGWIVNDKATLDKTMEIGHQLAWGDDSQAAQDHQMMLRCTRFLLFVTKYPEGTKTKEINPLILVVAIDPACSPGAHFPASVDDHQAINQIIHGFVPMFVGTIFTPKGHFSANAYAVQGHVMLHFSESFTIKPPGAGSPLDMFTSFDLTESKGYFLAWAFMSGSESESQELSGTKITFDPTPVAIPTAK